MKRFWIVRPASGCSWVIFLLENLSLTSQLITLLMFFVDIWFLLWYEGHIHILEMFWSVPRAETSPCSCSSVLFSGARCPHLHLFLSLLTPIRGPTSTPIFHPASPILGHLLTPTPACAAGLFGPRLCSVSGLWFSGLWVSGLWLRRLSLIDNRPPWLWWDRLASVIILNIFNWTRAHTQWILYKYHSN